MADFVGALDKCPAVPDLNETLRKSKAYYFLWRNTYFRKNTYFSENLRIFVRKNFVSSSPRH